MSAINTKLSATDVSQLYELDWKNTLLIIQNTSDSNIVTIKLWDEWAVADYEWITLFPKTSFVFDTEDVKFNVFSYKTVSWTAILSVHHS